MDVKESRGDNDEVVINILTRTSNRPIGFYNCYQSIINQTYKAVNHLVSYENELELKYINFEGVHLLKVKKYEGDVLAHPKRYLHAPYNLYCNELLKKVENGWVMFLDDDDHLLHNKVLREIVFEINKHDEDTMFIWQMRYPNGKLLPKEKHFKSKVVEFEQIGSPCFIFHSKYKNHVLWDEWKASDFRVIKNLCEKIPKKKWIKKVYVQINNYGDLGNRNDIVKDIRHKLIFKKNLFWYLLPKKHFNINEIYFFQIDTYKLFLMKNLKRIKRLCLPS